MKYGNANWPLPKFEKYKLYALTCPYDLHEHDGLLSKNNIYEFIENYVNDEDKSIDIFIYLNELSKEFLNQIHKCTDLHIKYYGNKKEFAEFLHINSGQIVIASKYDLWYY